MNKFTMLLLLPLALVIAWAGPASGQSKTYTLDADFDEGTLINVVHSPSDQLQLDDTTTPFNFIWVAVSSKGTVVKINTLTGAVLGEYRTTPSTDGAGNPSRTTVDKDGSVWVGNRSGSGSVIHIGLFENGQWEDRNSNGVCDTSTGLGDVKAWATSDVATADDECIIHYTYVNSSGTRHVSVDANNDVWVSGTSGQHFDLIRGGLNETVPNVSGTIIRSETSVGYGGYGGLIDPNGVIWSARRLLRWNTVNPLTGANGGNWRGYGHDSYGLGIDSSGNVWNTALYGNVIRKFAPDGTLLGTYSHGNYYAQGCVADGNGDIWVAHSILGPQSTVGHIKNDGTYVGNVFLASGAGPTGVSVDAAGKIWATGYNSRRVYRIDPTAGPIGGGGGPVGAVDFTSGDLGGLLYNYSDMTGSTLIGAPDNGTWTVVYDSGVVDEEWVKVCWNADEPGDSQISVKVASSTDGTTFTADVSVTNDTAFTVADGQHLRVSVSFARSTAGDTPILYDLTIKSNQAPDCSAAAPSLATLWPPNHKYVPISITGVTDPDGDPVTITIDSIFQDELVGFPDDPAETTGKGSGSTSPDGDGVGTSTAMLRAERNGNPKTPGNGRVYHITFTADDGKGGTCTSTVTVCVPHDQDDPTCGDEGPLFDSTGL